MAAHESQSPYVNQPWSKPSGRSMFGRQADSRKQNLPSYSLGGRTENRDKVFLSQSHVEIDRKCRDGPGHIYELPGAMDRQAEARKATAPVYSFARTERLKEASSETPGPGVYHTVSSIGDQPLSPNRSPVKARFGTSTREDAGKVYVTNSHQTRYRGTQGPPPGSYQVPGALGQQISSAKSTSPSFSLPRTDRLKEKYEELSKTMPAVGQYDTWQSIGKQTLSLSRTMPAYGFGSSNRDKESSRFLTVGHNKTMLGTQSPNNYDHQQSGTLTSFGKQSLGRKSTAPAYGFGSTPKMVFKTSTTPGPGAYD